MKKFVAKRVALSVVILFCVTFIIYTLMRCLPGSFVENMAMQLSQAPDAKPFEEWLAQLNETYGMDKGIIPGYFVWLSDAIRGDFGESWKYTVPVIQKFNDVIWLSFVMGGISFVLQLLIAIPLGVIASTKQYSRLDYDSRSADRYFAPNLLFCNIIKAFVFRKAGLVRPVWTGRTRLCAAGCYGTISRQGASPGVADRNFGDRFCRFADALYTY